MQIQPKVALINLGCSKNIVDSEIMLGLLDKAGYKVGLEYDDADVVIINTCSFIQDAEKESVSAIINQVDDNKKLVIVGCLVQKYKKEILENIPEVSAIVGTSEIDNIVEVVDKVLENTENHYIRVDDKLDFLQSRETKRFHITMGPTSYIKISEGCNCKCSYCIIPQLKGNYRSRDIESIVEEANALVENGVTEIVLIAQDTTSYGIDLYKRLALPDLLRKLNGIKGLSWIRIMYAYPMFVTDELLDVIATSEKVVKYLDIPIQHPHPDITASMNRPEVDLDLLIDKIRLKIPGIAFRTCFIVGYPGETDEQFDYLYSFVKKHRFERLGVFEYSKEDNTPAASLPGQVKAKVKKQRRNELMKLQQEISQENNTKLIGEKLDVLLETISNSGSGVGRSFMDAPEIDGLVYVKSVAGYLPGDIIPVRITKVTDYDLYGDLEIESA